MRIYSVFTAKKLNNEPEKQPLFVEEKFSLGAFFLQGFWFLFYRMWLLAFAIFLVEGFLIILLATDLISQVTFFYLILTIFFLIAFFAKSWYIKSLVRRDYVLNSVIVASNLDDAKLRFYQVNSQEIANNV